MLPTIGISITGGSAERAADEVLELTDGDPGIGAWIIVGCPMAWAYGIKAIACRERGEFEECERLLGESLRRSKATGKKQGECLIELGIAGAVAREARHLSRAAGAPAR